MKLPTWLEYLLGLRQRPRYVTSPGTANQPGRVRCVELRDGDSLWQGEKNYLRRLGERYYEFFDPRQDRTKPAPVVMLLHGRGGNAANARHTFQFEAEAEKRGWVVVYPAGQRLGVPVEFNLGWNDGVGQADPPKDDVMFLHHVLYDIESILPVGPLCVGGHSNGSAMAFRYGMRSDQVKCIAGNAGAIAPEAWSLRIPVFYSHSTDDPLVTYEDCVLMVIDWAKHNGANLERSKRSKTGNCIKYEYDHDQHPVARWSINPGAHSVPGGKAGPHEPFAEPINQDVSWAKEVAEFFERVM